VRLPVTLLARISLIGA